MEMGTGKTRTALELINQRLQANKVDFVLWLCPCSVKSTIKAELEKHIENGLEYFRIEGIESLSSSIRINSELLQLVQNKKVYLIVDESNLVKNHMAQRTKNIERLAEHCQYKLILNGTPISKCEKDLFAQWYILDWRILGYQSFWSFAANHLEYDEKKHGRITRVLNVDYLVKKIAPYTYQVKKEECLTLTSKTYRNIYVYMTEEQEWHYNEVKDAFLMQVDEIDSTTIYRMFTALQHVASGNRIVSNYKQAIETVPFFSDEAKNPRLIKLLDIIEDLEGKAIIWCKYTHEIKAIASTLKAKYGQSSVVEFYGGVSQKNRKLAIKNFSEEARFLIANKTCAGYGLNLQFCNQVIYYSNDFDWATRTQSEDRVHRFGQEREVFIYDIVMRFSIDGRIMKCLNSKERLVDNFKDCIEKIKDKNGLSKWIDGVEENK